MKIDNDKVAHTPDSKSLKNNNDIMEIAKETKIEVFPEPNGHETNNVGFWPLSDFDGPESPDKLHKGTKIVDDTKLLDELSVFTDKNVTECKVSEVVITPNETQQQPDGHEVREIHIDETASPSEKPEHNTSDVPEKEVTTTLATDELPHSIKLEEEKGVSGIKDVDNLSANTKLNHVSDSRAGSDRDFYGESSFSMASPMSGLIAYSGSLSLRSESSTTSTRSFAFPIMQNEWNSSPVRMAKADRSRLRKHKGWRQGILCCRF